mgnify:CR=1 FL=1
MISDCSSNYWISIHAPTRGATLLIEKRLLMLIFQSTLPREERQSQDGYIFNPFTISIHAPTRGATFEQWYVSNGFSISIHAPTRGATFPNIDIPDVAGFQSTLPREERLSGLF